jgi:hypothetical protein
MTRKKPPVAAEEERFPPVYIEALAYHEAGHAVMAVLLELPISKVGIGPGCDDPAFNGRVFLDLEACAKMPVFKAGLIEVASEAAEKLSPNFAQFATIHKRYPHLKPFRNGVRNDIAHGFQAVMITYQLLRLAESTTKQRFKAEYRDIAAKLIELNSEAVCRLAGHLRQSHSTDGLTTTSIILADGPLQHGGLLRHFRFPE